MLESLYVKNLALIREAEIGFSDHLNILSGETGAGKSILLGGINLALGMRADQDLIRKNEKSAYTELIFRIDDPELRTGLQELGVETEEDRVIISRRISEGKSQSRINGEAVTLAHLRKISELLIDIHGQHEHQSLLKEENHLTVLDAFSRNTIAEEKEAYQKIYREYRNKREELKLLNAEPEALQERLSFLEYEISEIRDAHLSENDEEALNEELTRLSNAYEIRSSLTAVENALSGDGNEGLHLSIQLMQDALKFDPSLKSLQEQLLSIDALSQEALSETRRRIASYEFDEQRLHDVEERFSFITRLKRKYGQTVRDILKGLSEKEAEHGKLKQLLTNREALLHELSAVQEKLVRAADRLHEKRKEAGELFSKSMENALQELNFLSVRFCVQTERISRFTQEGADQVAFLISLNPGEDVKPLAKVASGGELSRIMLAIKTLCADTDRIPTLIFDEIDSGISGKTASLVAEKMRTIAKKHQVICISHLPQIVSKADHHFLIEKSVQNESTVTQVRKLSEEESVLELARLLGDGSLGESAVQNAREMKEAAGN